MADPLPTQAEQDWGEDWAPEEEPITLDDTIGGEVVA